MAGEGGVAGAFSRASAPKLAGPIRPKLHIHQSRFGKESCCTLYNLVKPSPSHDEALWHVKQWYRSLVSYPIIAAIPDLDAVCRTKIQFTTNSVL